MVTFYPTKVTGCHFGDLKVNCYMLKCNLVFSYIKSISYVLVFNVEHFFFACALASEHVSGTIWAQLLVIG